MELLHSVTEQAELFLVEAERERWNAFVAESPWGHLMQAWEWGAFKQALGWQVYRIGIRRDGRLVAGLQVLFKRLPLFPLAIAYIPKGPVVDLADEGTVQALFSAAHRLARDKKAILLKVEPNYADNDQTHQLLRQYGFQSTALTNQPRATIVIDLTQGEEALRANMRKKTRQLIRRAAQGGVEIVEGDLSDIESFYRTLSSAAELKGFPVHGQAFYQQAWKAFQGTGGIKLMLAKYEGQVVAAKIICIFVDKSMHLWGGTSRVGREVYASYLLQWESIKWAAAHGCRKCDLWGIPDEIGEMLKSGQEIPKDRRDGLWGVYSFKRGYGGEIEYFVGAYDYAYRPLLYKLATRILSRHSSVDAMASGLERINDSWRSQSA